MHKYESIFNYRYFISIYIIPKEEVNQMKQLTILFTLSTILISTLISGCTDTIDDNHTDQTDFYDVSLQEISLTDKDFSSDFRKIGENHTTEPTTVENITGNGLKWNILERYDVTFYANTTNGVMESIIKLESRDAAYNLTLYSKDNIVAANYTLQTIYPIGDICFLLNNTLDYSDYQVNFYTLLFSKGNIFVALGGSAPEQTTFINYATTIDNNLNMLLQE